MTDEDRIIALEAQLVRVISRLQRLEDVFSDQIRDAEIDEQERRMNNLEVQLAHAILEILRLECIEAELRDLKAEIARKSSENT